MKTYSFNKLAQLALIPAVALGVSLPIQAKGNAADAGMSNKSGASTSAHSMPSAMSSATYRGVRASEMIGMSVRNVQGDNIGQISDMVVNMNTGDVRYAILKFDPGILEGEKLFAVPTTELRIAADRDDVVYDMSETRLERAAIDPSDWTESVLEDPDYLAKLDKVWGIKQPARGAMAHRASDLIGKDVNSRSGEKIGEVEELIVNMAQQKVHYAVLGFDPGWATPEQNYAFPLRSFDLTDGKDELVLDITKSQLQAMKSFPDSRYSNLDDSAWVADIDRYFVTILPVGTAGTAGTADSKGATMADNSNTTGTSAAGSSASGGSTADASSSPSTLFSRLDEDANGSLDKAEVKDTADVDSNWTRFDKNDDERISREEFTSNYTIEPGR